MQAGQTNMSSLVAYECTRNGGRIPGFMLRRMRHQEHWRAVGTHYGPARIYRPTVRAIEGTAQLALRSSSAAAIIAGPRHSQ